MSLFTLALRNLFRAKRRVVLSSAAIVVGVFYLIIGQSFIGGMNESIVRSAEDGLTGHLLLRPADYPKFGAAYPVDVLLTLTPDARTLLAGEATAWTERQIFSVTASSSGDSLRLRGIGYDPVRDPSVFSRQVWEVDGVIPETAEQGVLLTSGAARLLELKAGDSVVLQARTHKGAINALEVPIAGLVTTTNMAIDRTSVYVPQALTRDLIRSELPSHIGVKLAHRDEAFGFGDRLLAAQGSTAEVLTWFDETKDLLRMQEIRSKALNMLVAVLMLMSSLAIANTILMAAHERTREIGTLRAMGMTKARVLALFLTEGGLMGVGAGLLGAVLGGGGAYYLSLNPVNLANFAGNGMGDQLQFSSWLYGEFSWPIVLIPVLVSIVVAVLASIYPARVASKMVVAEAVRAE